MSRLDTPSIFARLRAKMEADGSPELVIAGFLQNVQRWMDGDVGVIARQELCPIGDLPQWKFLEAFQDDGEEAIARTVIIKLNGGLGTSMGLEKAKSLIVARNGLSFLEIILEQTHFLRSRCRARLPLFFMNSFSTSVDTLEAIEKSAARIQNPDGLPLAFCQHRVPKLNPETHEAAEWPAQPELTWCPPGHADLYQALQTTRLLEQLLKQGFRYAFVSNSDNLGALLDMRILGYMAKTQKPFLMEVTERTENDRKGGHLARSARTGRLLLRESAQCPKEEIDEFQDINRYQYFNTNNLWINLEALAKMLVDTRGIPVLPLIVNHKPIDPTDTHSMPIVQLESAMGAAISCFDQAEALVVPRQRFAPVKTTNDLLAIRSDVYTLGEERQVALNPHRFGPPPVITLDPRYYRNIADFEMRFADGPLSLMQCDSLNITGDIRFGKNIHIEGDVHLHNPTTTPAFIQDNTRIHTPIQ